MTKRRAIIDNIDIIVVLKINFLKLTIQRLIHFKKIIVISFHTNMIIVVYHVELSIIKKNFFESNDNFNFILYVYFVDAFIKFIIVRNDKNLSIMIFKNFRFDEIFEIHFFKRFSHWYRWRKRQIIRCQKI